MMLIRWLWKVEELFLMGSLGFMSMLTFVAVISRFTFSYPLPWSEELTRYLFMWMCMVGTSVGIRKGAHIGIDIVTNRLSLKVQRAIDVIGIFIALAFCIVLISVGSDQMIAQSNQLSSAMELNMGIVYASIPVGAALMTISLIFTLVERFSKSTDLKGVKR
jgi:TRAP-type C4-dicarboxylate transport system permease small subunit